MMEARVGPEIVTFCKGRSSMAGERERERERKRGKEMARGRGRRRERELRSVSTLDCSSGGSLEMRRSICCLSNFRHYFLI